MSGVRRKKFRRFKVITDLVGCPGGGSPTGEGNPHGLRRIFENVEIFLMKIANILVYFSKSSKPSVKFSRVWTKSTIVSGNVEKMSKIQ